jgi:dTDP-glucose pyrophosphorylase
MKDITVQTNITIRQAMKALEKTSEKCILVVDKNKKLLGTLTDGDLRRSILRGLKFSEDISTSFNTKPTILIQDKYDIEEAFKLLRNLKIDLIPIVNQANMVVDYFTWSDMGGKVQPKKSLKNVPVVIMAGGKGTRLEPFTKVLPKPLIPIHDKPLIEHIIERFTQLGCLDFYLTINYKGKILKAFIEELQPSYKVHFIEEHEPLGTAGSLCFLDGEFKHSFFVTNCDIIVKANYASIYEFHQEGDYDITLVASSKEYVIPYGNCELNSDGSLANIHEKPRYDFLINTGLYILNPNVLPLIQKNKVYHITDLIKDAQKQGKKVGVFPIDDDAWIDVGQWSEYRQAVENL